MSILPLLGLLLAPRAQDGASPVTGAEEPPAAQEQGAPPLTADQQRFERIQARVLMYRQGVLAADVPQELAGMVGLASQMGLALHRLDSAALRASAALVAGGAISDPRLWGWLCIDAGEVVHVIFAGGAPDGSGSPGGLYHALVPMAGGPVQWGDFSIASAERPLRDEPGSPPEELFPFDEGMQREWQARQAVLAAHPPAPGSAVDTLVIQLENTPGAQRYLVFQLARAADKAAIQLGGHGAWSVRFQQDRLSIEPYALSQPAELLSRAELEAAQQEPDFPGLIRSTGDVPVPRELHVYESLVNQLPFYLATQQQLWRVDGIDIRYLGRLSNP